ncbi:MAG: 50S ribosomal protein L29 [bacterium]
MKTKELKGLSEAELRQKVADNRTELFNLRMQKSTGRIERPLRLRTLRREVARILTLMKQRGIN